MPTLRWDFCGSSANEESFFCAADGLSKGVCGVVLPEECMEAMFIAMLVKNMEVEKVYSFSCEEVKRILTKA